MNVGTPNTCRKLATKGIEEIKTPYEVRKGMNPIAMGAQPHQRGGADTRHGDVRAQRQARCHSGRPNIIRHTHQRKKWVSKSNTTPTFPKEAGRKRTNHKVRQKAKQAWEELTTNQAVNPGPIARWSSQQGQHQEEKCLSNGENVKSMRQNSVSSEMFPAQLTNHQAGFDSLPTTGKESRDTG